MPSGNKPNPFAKMQKQDAMLDKKLGKNDLPEAKAKGKMVQVKNNKATKGNPFGAKKK